jgi:Xaa-Pro aminopeptidase
MALHFSPSEFENRMERLRQAMSERRIDAMLLFSQESMYWLSGYDTFGFCFFQCLVVTASGEMALLTRAPDLRQARHTSIIDNIVIWTDRQDADPTQDLHEMMSEMDLVGARLGVEYDTPGLNARHGIMLNERLKNFAEAIDASEIIPKLRMIKSRAELTYVRKAAALADDAFDQAIRLTKAGADEGEILAAMHSAIFSAGGDYPGNEFIIGSGRDALLCRYKSGRRKLSKNDQLTLEWAGVWAHYHATMMRTLIIGKPKPRHLELYDVARKALEGCRDAMQIDHPVSEIFDAHARVLDDAGLARHRLNACGYSLGASFTPCWMDSPIIYGGNQEIVQPNMVLFLHIIIADSESDTAMTLGQTYVSGTAGPKQLSRHEIDLIVC